jgi:hypothetical protein
VDLSNF